MRALQVAALALCLIAADAFFAGAPQISGNLPSVQRQQDSKALNVHAARPAALKLATRRGQALGASVMDPAKVDATEPDPFADEAFATNKPRWKKKTKQVATLGPASSSLEMIEALFLAGADVFRLNFSHGAHDEKAKLVELIREVETKYRHPICVLADLQGPKLRVDVFEHDKVTVVQGQQFRFDMEDEPGDARRVKLPHPEIINTLGVGDVLLIDDGKLKMTVTESGEGYVDCYVDVGGSISNRKGVNTPTVTLPISPLTPKDRKDLAFALEIPGGVDVIALSFVQKPEDIVELKELVQGRAKVLAKIEKPQAVENLEAIVELCDAIMVARGDLGVEMNIEDVPITQKQIIKCCRRLGKPVVVATQMLESMIDNPTPTRAEASDVATAIYDGADAIMLSAESAAGKYPIESVTMQQRIITRVETDPEYRKQMKLFFSGDHMSATDAITQAAKSVATSLNAVAIVTFSSRGTTTLRAAMLRPEMPVLGITPNIETARSLALAWGVYPAVVSQTLDGNTPQNYRTMLTKSCAVALRKRIAEDPSDLLVVTAGLPFGTPGIANILRVLPAAGPDVWDPSLTSDIGDVDEAYVNYDDEN
ncbi:pyruvate kinase [Tribonema minus]|uniref:Pyruvate kinase n=1 Tax=Tribonema minus TaxID=303371 RepID=A0A836CA73_9STRA|nr:pyruvate kinase [Tribonema minus]